MKRYIVSETELSRRAVRGIAEDIIREHGENNSIGKFDRFIKQMMNNWAESGQDEEFIRGAIERAYEKEFGE